MSVETWLSYVVIYAVISIIPGPSVLMVTATALSHGRASAMRCILGDLLGGVVIMAAAYFGVGAILATSASVFAILKWLGVAYMAGLGLMQIQRAWSATGALSDRQGAPAKSLRAGFLTGVLNPKAILFYMAFLAQFVDPSSPALPQFLVLMISSSMIVALVLGAYAFLAAGIARHLRTVRAQRRVALSSGAMLLGSSAWMAATR
ncbi:LysE family translocator [Thioclava sp.]|uniref:LysE family translocator n=1 Tax=Thioclava sp. TaxID=1933450 RepID=UPI003AA9DEFF